MTWTIEDSRRMAAALGLIAGLAAPACSMPGKVAEVPDDTADASTPEAALAAFDRAEEELSQVMVVQYGKDERGLDEADDDDDDLEAPPPAPQPMTPRPERQASGTSDQAPYQAKNANICTRACKALGSMMRSAERLCELTGEQDERCENVTLRVRYAQGLVEMACPSCR